MSIVFRCPICADRIAGSNRELRLEMLAAHLNANHEVPDVLAYLIMKAEE